MNTIFFFEPSSFYILVIGLVFLISSIFSFEVSEKSKLSLILLFLAGLFICTFMALLDPFLNSWDERFHALVAKNLISHPFTPTLFNTPLISYEYTNWTANYIWLHKQPLFLWQIALSIKLFGLNELAVRIPSIVMMSILPLFIYRIGKISLNKQIGFYGALLFATSFYVHDLVSGFPPSDHNDVAFVFYVSASIWAWLEYEHSQKRYWLLLIGLFSGCAVLIKWLTGLLVFSGWGLSILFNKEKRKDFSSYKNMAMSLFICLVVFMPWQIYISQSFPKESSYEYSLNSKHFTDVVEQHDGNAWYYFENIGKVYGEGQMVPYLLLLSFIFLFRNLKENKYRIAFFSYLIIVYSFFSLAATKMLGFCFIVSPFVYLSLGSLIENIFAFLKNRLLKNNFLKHFVLITLLALIGWGNLDMHQVAYKHTLLLTPNDNDKRIEKVNDAIFIKSLKTILPSEDYVIFYCKPQTNISIMYYTNYIAYDTELTYENYNLLKSKKIKIGVIDNGKLPYYLVADLSVIKIKAPDKTWME